MADETVTSQQRLLDDGMAIDVSESTNKSLTSCFKRSPKSKSKRTIHIVDSKRIARTTTAITTASTNDNGTTSNYEGENDNGQSSSSAHDPGILMTSSSAHRLASMFHFHAFFLYHDSDRQWVFSLIRRLESAPQNYRCCYDLRDFARNNSALQNVVCSSILSERIILVISSSFINHTWPLWSGVLQQMLLVSHNATINGSGSPRRVRPRLIAIYLETDLLSRQQPTTDVALELRSLCSIIPGICADDARFWDQLLFSLRREGGSTQQNLSCGSTTTIWSAFSQQATGFPSNGQLQAKAVLTRRGMFCPKPHAELITRSGKMDLTMKPQKINHKPPDLSSSTAIFSSSSHSSTPSYDSIVNRLLWQEDLLQHSLSSLMPTVLIVIGVVVWVTSSALVILLLPDNSKAVFPVRLCVFVLPAIALLGCGVHCWRRQRLGKLEVLRRFFLKCIYINACLCCEGNNHLLTVRWHRVKEEYCIYLFSFSIQECCNETATFLTQCSSADLIIISTLVDFYTRSVDFMKQDTLANRLCCMASASYSLHILNGDMGEPYEQRHTKRHQCLCQYVMDFLVLFLPHVRDPLMAQSSDQIDYILNHFLHWHLVFAHSESITGLLNTIHELDVHANPNEDNQQDSTLVTVTAC